jgi:hypothetical protein
MILYVASSRSVDRNLGTNDTTQDETSLANTHAVEGTSVLKMKNVLFLPLGNIYRSTIDLNMCFVVLEHMYDEHARFGYTRNVTKVPTDHYGSRKMCMI